MTVRRSGERLIVGFRVSPSARTTRVQGLYGDRLKVQVSAPPEDDKANSELVSAVAGWLGLPVDCVCIHSGQRSRDKVLAFTGVDEESLRERLLVLGGR